MIVLNDLDFILTREYTQSPALPKKSYVTNSAIPSDVRKRSALPFRTVKILGLRPENWA